MISLEGKQMSQKKRLLRRSIAQAVSVGKDPVVVVPKTARYKFVKRFQSLVNPKKP